MDFPVQESPPSSPSTTPERPRTSLRNLQRKRNKDLEDNDNQKRDTTIAPLAHAPRSTRVSSTRTKLPDVESLHLLPEQLKNPLFVAIAKTLVVYGNDWQSAPDLVEGIRQYKLANLRGPTPTGTVQGAVSKALALSHSLGTFDPIIKRKMNGTTFYRLAPKVLDPSIPADDSDITESDSHTAQTRKGGSSKNSSTSSGSKPNVRSKNSKSTAKPSSGKGTSRSGKKRKITSGWESDTLSSDSSEDESVSSSRQHTKRRNHNNQKPSPAAKIPTRRGSIPNGLKKLPKGYVYDTEINQAALMKLSINPSQTGEYMQHLRGKNAMENNFPDRRGEFGVDLNQEPSMFALEQQTGYTYPRLRNSGKERLPKGECEDGYAIADLKHKGGFLGRLFCITDGHGGNSCSSFVIATIPGAMQVILGKYKPTDLSIPSVQDLVRSQITEAVRLIDKEYLEYKKQQYLLFRDKMIPDDPGSDGTTLIVNIFIDKWIICLNLGDSRSMLGIRDSIGRWNVEFNSEDHTPSLERLAQTIYANGGEFVTHDDKVIRFDPNLKNDKKHRQSLREARIRVRDGESNQYGIPYRTQNGHCASVNLGACIGDVLYKLDSVNPILSCKPDITFIDTSEIQQGFLLMATDGLWDYVKRGGKLHDQNVAVCQFVGDKIDRGWNYQRIVHTLADREGTGGLYSDSIQEYDDFTAILVKFNKEQVQHQQQRWREYDQRQQLLLLQRQRDVEQLQRLQKLQIEKDKAEQEQLRLAQEQMDKEIAKKGSNSDDETDSDTPMPDTTPRCNNAVQARQTRTTVVVKTERNTNRKAEPKKEQIEKSASPTAAVEATNVKQEIPESSFKERTSSIQPPD
ncbi:Protein phosphatase 1L [Mortierella polycephala]|uniref:Protein phosphatase 1L n=1 Tax=Mortierella polycephala TaxID=41804 RepID=A0A9P6QAE9_9FUNG|nr:Protein phosphatase 1L [Mortierella polycephala]